MKIYSKRHPKNKPVTLTADFLNFDFTPMPAIVTNVPVKMKIVDDFSDYVYDPEPVRKIFEDFDKAVEAAQKQKDAEAEIKKKTAAELERMEEEYPKAEVKVKMVIDDGMFYAPYIPNVLDDAVVIYKVDRLPSGEVSVTPRVETQEEYLVKYLERVYKRQHAQIMDRGFTVDQADNMIKLMKERNITDWRHL